MLLLTKVQREQLLENGRRQAAVKGTDNEIDFRPVVKLFTPYGSATWLLTEIDPADETVAWGLCDLGMGVPEFGTVSLTDLSEYRGRFGLGIERDRHFTARGPISAYIRAADKSRTYRREHRYMTVNLWAVPQGAALSFSASSRTNVVIHFFSRLRM